MAQQHLSASERGIIEARLRRAGGIRVLVVVAMYGLVGAIALGTFGQSDDEADATQSSAKPWQPPASLELQFRREALAAASPGPDTRVTG
jgi:hypothetical protein